MDGSRFDAFAKSLAAPQTRRGVLGLMMGAVIGVTGRGQSTEARSCRSIGNTCADNGNCCSGACVTESRSRKTCHCTAPAHCPTGDQCHLAVCAAGACSTPVAVGAACSDGNRCTINDVCQSNGTCAGTPVLCSAPNECFTAGSCQPATGACSPTVYHGDGGACSGGVCFNQSCCASEPLTVTCASGKCGSQTNNCGLPVTCLTLAGESCAQDADCCSGICVTNGQGLNGICLAGPVALGGSCDSNGDCSSHHCCAGICRDLAADPDHCGACETVCSSNHISSRTCAAGVCNGACTSGFADCDGNKQTNGCETDLSADDVNCGRCQHVCPAAPAHGANHCASGVCTVSCDSGYDNCDGTCVHLQTDAAHCGTCSNVCSTVNGTPGCVGGVCTVAGCTAGFADCNGVASDGCEVSINTSPDHCGGCDIVCSGDHVTTRTCTTGVCTGTCAAGYADCNGNRQTDGCETSINADVNNCGACGNVCPSGPFSTATCVAGQCGLTCITGFANCNGDPSTGCQTSLLSDPNCGACGSACSDSGRTCIAGQCYCGSSPCACGCAVSTTGAHYCLETLQYQCGTTCSTSSQCRGDSPICYASIFGDQICGHGACGTTGTTCRS